MASSNGNRKQKPNARKKAAKPSKTPEQKKRRNQQIIGVILIVVAIFVQAGGFFLDKLNLVQFNRGFDASQTKRASEVGAGELAGEKYIGRYPGMPTGNIYRDKNVINILLLGTDDRTTRFDDGVRSDSMMMVSIDTKKNSVKLVSFERAIGVPILEGQYKGQVDWLTHCFCYGNADLVMKELQACFLLDVNRYIRTNILCFMELINIVGGVDIELTPAEANYINTDDHCEDLGYKVRSKKQYAKPGVNHMNGTTAMIYARCREVDSDWGRMGRQRTVVTKVFEKVQNMSPTELNDAINKMMPLVMTNLTKGEMATLIFELPGLTSTTVETMVIPEKGAMTSMLGMEGRSVFWPNYRKNAKDLKEFLYDID